MNLACSRVNKTADSKGIPNMCACVLVVLCAVCSVGQDQVCVTRIASLQQPTRDCLSFVRPPCIQVSLGRPIEIALVASCFKTTQADRDTRSESRSCCGRTFRWFGRPHYHQQNR